MKAYNLVKNSGWCQKAYAKKANGEICNWRDEEATCYCLMGAIFRAYGEDEYLIPLNKVYKALECNTILSFNDNPQTTKEDILALLEKAGV